MKSEGTACENNAPKQRIFVTGAAGFIGSHLVEALIAGGHEVTALVHYNSAGNTGHLRQLSPASFARIRLVFGDVCDPEQMLHAVEGHDVIIHAAALIGIPYSYVAPRSYLRTNTEAAMNLLEAGKVHGVRRFVYVSTSEVYGSAKSVPIRETHPLQAQSPYSASKIAAEALVEAWHRNFGVPAIIIRPFNTYGPRQSQRAIIPTIIGQALAGEVLKLGALFPIRDFCYVTDTAAGLVAAAFDKDGGLGPYNLGTGAGVSIGDLVATIGRLLGRDLTVVEDPARLRPPEGEVDRLISDNSAWRAVSGWKPLAGLEEGLRRTIAAFSENPAGQGLPSYVV
jgi:nucleoside-diphosphate-sugar epimerase